MAEESEVVQIELNQQDTSSESGVEGNAENRYDEKKELHDSSKGCTSASETENSSHESSVEDTSSTQPNLFCRICHEKDKLTERNVSPCKCKGTLSLVHRSCLREWLLASDSTQCELCGFQFTVKRIPKYSVLRSLWLWVKRENSPVERRFIVNSLATLILDFPLILSSNYLWFAQADSLLQAMERIMDVILPYQEGQDLFNDTLTLLGQVVNLMLICPLGILTGSHLMIYVFRVFEHSRLWYAWHRRQTTLIFTEPVNKPE